MTLYLPPLSSLDERRQAQHELHCKCFDQKDPGVRKKERKKDYDICPFMILDCTNGPNGSLEKPHWTKSHFLKEGGSGIMFIEISLWSRFQKLKKPSLIVG